MPNCSMKPRRWVAGMFEVLRISARKYRCDGRIDQHIEEVTPGAAFRHDSSATAVENVPPHSR